MLTRHDLVLAAIPMALLAGALASYHPAIALYQGIALGSLLASGVLFEALFRNPPVPTGRSEVVAAAAVGAGWVVSVLLFV